VPICDLAMKVILEMIKNLLPFDIPFMFKYVDDILLCCPGNLKEEILEIFNSINNNRLPYLDLQIIRNSDGSIDTGFLGILSTFQNVLHETDSFRPDL
jgi:hypothetical protein